MTTETVLPHDLVTDPDYFRDVMLNMEWVPGAANRGVRFGTGGDGLFPNYQTGWVSDHPLNHKVHRFRGRTHRAYHDAPLATFNEAKLTRAFTYPEVTGMLDRALKAKKSS